MIAGAVCALALATWAAGSASAATITVSNTNDSGAGSLRQAIAGASSGDTIVVPASAAHYAVTSAPLTVNKSLTISGGGTASTVLDAMGGAHRVFEITVGTVTISSLTITGASGVAENGGAISLAGAVALTLSGASVSGNTTAPGEDGAAIDTHSGASLTVNASTIANNRGANNGGALYLEGTTAITGSTFTGNQVTGDGGAIQNNGSLTVSASTIADNAAAENGGGLYLAGTTVIANSTISGNRAGSDGGAINQGGSLTLTNDTISANESGNGHESGGGIFGGAEAKNTILADNGDNLGLIDNCSFAGTIVSTGPNLENGSECKFSAHGGISEQSPALGALANNGGPTATQDLLAGSPAIDHGTNTGCPTTDQRGVPRPQGVACDIGAVEHTVPGASTPTVSNITTTGATLTALASTVFLGGSFSYRYGPTSAYGSSTPSLPLLAGLGSEAVTATLTGLAPGSTYHAQLLVTSPDGGVNSADVAFTTASPPPAAVAPSVTGVHESHTKWRDGQKLAQITRKRHKRHRKPPVGTTFSFTLNEPATVTFSFTERVGGRRSNGKCVGQTKKNRRKPACRRTVTAATLSFMAHPGANKIVFQGRISHRKKLKPGRYTLVITASNAAGQRSLPQTISFSIVK